MIYFLIGTKAQLIKTFPVMKRMEALGQPYSYLDTVQHGPLCEKLRRTLGVREPDHFLATPDTQIERTLDAVIWAFGVLARGLRHRRTWFPQPGVVVVHGDTLSTLLGWMLAKLAGQRVCHLEAGERTWRLLRPFPEEIIRRIVDRYSDLLLACGDQQAGNLERTGLTARTVNLAHNTLIDAVRTVAAAGVVGGAEAVVLVSIHRFETITSRERMEFLVSAVERLTRTSPVLWGVHPPTRRKLEEFGLWARLNALPRLHLRGLFDYPEFIRAIAQARFIMTDGGGPQEESHFLGVPCLLLRTETERTHANVHMAQWDLAGVEWFDAHFGQFRRPAASFSHSPSERAATAILALDGAKA